MIRLHTVIYSLEPSIGPSEVLHRASAHNPYIQIALTPIRDFDAFLGLDEGTCLHQLARGRIGRS